MASRSTSSTLTRRQFGKRVAASAAAASAGPYIANARAARRERPNLLFLWTDEQRPDTMSVYGNRAIHAPNLNRFSEECVVFDKCYVSQPVCTPSRSTVMTGLWPHMNGCTQNNVALREDVPTLPEMVGGDYATGYFGKWHLGDEIFAQHGFREWRSIEDTYARYYREGRERDGKSDYHNWLLGLGYEPEGDGFSREFAAGLPIEHCKPKFLEQQTCDFLRRHRNEPFMLYVNFLEPHMPFTGPLNNEHDPAEVTLPANFDDPIEENEPEAYRKKYLDYVENGYNEYDLKKESDWRRLIANYWGLVTQVDRSVGAILTALEELGLADNTVVVYTSDHGDMMGAHRMITKSVMYEEAARVPWLMRVPGAHRQQIVKQPVSHIDLVPTVLDVMGLETDRELPGHSLTPLLRNGQAVEDHVFIEWNPPIPFVDGPNPGGSLLKTDAKPGLATRTVVSPDGWKLCLHDQDRNQLFNLADDPGETTNVYERPEHREVIDRLAKRIHDWQAGVGDTLEVEAE